MTDQMGKKDEASESKIIIKLIEIEIPEEKKEFFASVKYFVLEVMNLAIDCYDRKRLLTTAMSLCAVEAVEANLRKQEFERLVWEGAIGLFFKEFQCVREGSYDPIAFLNLNFKEEIARYRNDLENNYSLHIPKA